MSSDSRRSADGGDWQQRLAVIVETMREMSRQTDPQAMVRAYGRRMEQLLASDGFVALSRRELEPPFYRITRASRWKEEINPWKQKDRLPVHDRGVLGELLYGDEPQIIDEIRIAPDDPAAEYFPDRSSLMALPNYDCGVSMNMTVLMREPPAGFSRESFPEWVWMANLFGRATHNLVLADQVETAYRLLDHELKLVADIQRSLLPAELPDIPTMKLAVHYQTSQRAGGDYYDFFPLPDDRWGILIADVSGHGTPAAVVMAITHSIAHNYPGPPTPPGRMLKFLNHHLSTRTHNNTGSFVTAFYGIYNPKTRSLGYACAGHHPPRRRQVGSTTVSTMDGVSGLPLGVSADESYEECTVPLQAGDRILFYTDGITEAHNPAGDMFETDRLDDVLARSSGDAQDGVEAVLNAVDTFTAGEPVLDDRTLLVADIG